MSGLRGVLNYAGCFAEAAGSVDRVNGWDQSLSHILLTFMFFSSELFTVRIQKMLEKLSILEEGSSSCKKLALFSLHKYCQTY